jgi:phage FluMu protein gp41
VPTAVFEAQSAGAGLGVPELALKQVDVVADLNGPLAVRAHGRLVVREEERLVVVEALRHLGSVQPHNPIEGV